MTVHVTPDPVLVTDPDAVLAQSAETTDIYDPVIQAATVTVSTDANGKATVPFVRPYEHVVFSVTVTRVTSSGTKGLVTVAGVAEDLSGFSVLLHNAAGSPEASVQRRLSYTAVGSD